MWLVIKLQMYPTSPTIFLLLSVPPPASTSSPEKQTRKKGGDRGGKKPKKQENNKKRQEQRMLKGIMALGNRLNCLCVKSRGEEGQAGDREADEKTDSAAVGSGRLQRHFFTMVAPCHARAEGWGGWGEGHVGPPVSGMWDEKTNKERQYH